MLLIMVCLKVHILIAREKPEFLDQEEAGWEEKIKAQKSVQSPCLSNRE
jgi:hypothetical protein